MCLYIWDYPVLHKKSGQKKHSKLRLDYACTIQSSKLRICKSMLVLKKLCLSWCKFRYYEIGQLVQSSESLLNSHKSLAFKRQKFNKGRETADVKIYRPIGFQVSNIYDKIRAESLRIVGQQRAPFLVIELIREWVIIHVPSILSLTCKYSFGVLFNPFVSFLIN